MATGRENKEHFLMVLVVVVTVQFGCFFYMTQDDGNKWQPQLVRNGRNMNLLFLWFSYSLFANFTVIFYFAKVCSVHVIGVIAVF